MNDWKMTPEPRPDGRIDLRAYRFVGTPQGEPDVHERESYTLSYEDAWSLYQNLGGCLRNMGDDRMRSIAAGNCDGCQNFRMITVEGKYGTERQHCPDCYERYSTAEPCMPHWPETGR